MFCVHLKTQTKQSGDTEIEIYVHLALTISCPLLFVSIWFWLFLRKDMVYRWAREYPPEDHTDQACEYSRRQPSQSV